MLEDTFYQVYAKFKLNFYWRIFDRLDEREDALTAVETFCMEAICSLGHPSINQFANFVRISQANAAYKVGKLIKKGYLTKERSRLDKREYRLTVTQKYLDRYGVSYDYIRLVMDRARLRFSPQELSRLEEMLRVISLELMPEISLPELDDFRKPD